MTEHRLASVISGGGSTMEAILVAAQYGELKNLILPAVVIATADNIGGITKARALHVPVEVLPRENFPRNKEGMSEYGRAMLKILLEYGVNVITLNGCLVKIAPEVITVFESSMFNQHPGPVPEFGGKGMHGLRVHATVLKYHELAGTPKPQTEVIAQRVARDFDAGAVVKRKIVPIVPGDTPETLRDRALTEEHDLQVELLADYAHGFLRNLSASEYAKTDADKKLLEEAKAYALSMY